VDGHQLFTSATVGIAISTTGYERPEEVLRDATIALNRAKADGNSSCEIFDPAMRQRAVARLRVETDLRNAIESHEFEVHSQPIVSLRTGRIKGFEALVRWRHPLRGLVSPGEFIPLAEDTGLMSDITRLTLTERLQDVRDVGGVHGAEALVELRQILAVLKAFEKVAPRTFLAVRQRFEETVLVEQPRDIGQARLQVGVGSDGRHGEMVRAKHDVEVRLKPDTTYGKADLKVRLYVRHEPCAARFYLPGAGAPAPPAGAAAPAPRPRPWLPYVGTGYTPRPWYELE
jgi:hypothetical protein